MNSRIIGSGSYYLSDINTSADSYVTIDMSDEWIADRTVIKERRIIRVNEIAATRGFEMSEVH
mgnify:CR=1 FL=1